MQKAVIDRLSGKFQKSDFYNFLDMPYESGGVGLNKKTAKSISEEMELILILGYGIMSKLSLPDPEDHDEEAGQKDRNKAEAAKKEEEDIIIEEIGASQSGKKDGEKAEDITDSSDKKLEDMEIKKYREIVAKELEAAEKINKANEADKSEDMPVKNGQNESSEKNGNSFGKNMENEKEESGHINKINNAPSLQDAIQMAQMREEELKKG
jgi:hypothetical protein